MNVLTNLLIFSIVIALFGQVASQSGFSGASTTVLDLVLNCQLTSETTTTCGADVVDYNLYTLLFTGITGIFVLGGIAAVIGTISFPNQFALFAGVAASLALTFAVMPYALFNFLPFPANALLTIVYSVGVFLGVLNWFKGGTAEP